MTITGENSGYRDPRTDAIEGGANGSTIDDGSGIHTGDTPNSNCQHLSDNTTDPSSEDNSRGDHNIRKNDGHDINDESIEPKNIDDISRENIAEEQMDVKSNNGVQTVEEKMDQPSTAEDPSVIETSTQNGAQKPKRKRRKPEDIDLKEEFRKEAKPLFIIALLFLFIPLVATFIAPSFVEEDVKAFGDNEESYWNSVIYLVLILTFTFGILWVVKHFGKDPLRVIILGAFFMTMIYAFYPILAYIVPIEIAVLIGFVLSIIITYFLVTFPEWYVVDSAGISVSIGVAAIIGISFAPGPFIFLMLMMLCYDAIAVYKTKHMIDLADNVMESNLPVLLVIPKKLPYTFLKKKGLKEQLDSGEERDALFIGLGDFIIPSSFAVSLSVYLGDNVSDTTVIGIDGVAIVVAGVILGTLVGYLILMAYVLKGKPQAGLPLLNGGAILGYLIPVLAIYGSLGLW